MHLSSSKALTVRALTTNTRAGSRCSRTASESSSRTRRPRARTVRSRPSVRTSDPSLSSRRSTRLPRSSSSRAGGDKQPFMNYKMTDVLITSVHPGGTGKGEAIPLEEVSISFGKIEWKYTQTKVQGGRAAGNVAGGWDLKTNKKV